MLMFCVFNILALGYDVMMIDGYIAAGILTIEAVKTSSIILKTSWLIELNWYLAGVQHASEYYKNNNYITKYYKLLNAGCSVHIKRRRKPCCAPLN